MLRAIPLLSALALMLPSPSQAAFVSAAPASLPPATSENASTAFLNDGSESRIGLLCHNDPADHSDPTGLIDNSAWNRLMLWQGGGDGTVSEQMTGILQQQQQQAGNDGATVTGQQVRPSSRDPSGAGSNSASESGEPMQFVPGKEEDNRYYKYVYHQLTSGGKPVAGYDYAAKEQTTVIQNNFTGVKGGKAEVVTTDKEYGQLTRRGLFKDRIGLGFQPSSRVSGKLILDQRFLLQYKGQEGPRVSTELRHVTEVTNGNVFNFVIVLTP